jgi:hypothetical protein
LDKKFIGDEAWVERQDRSNNLACFVLEILGVMLTQAKILPVFIESNSCRPRLVWAREVTHAKI